MRPTPKLPPVMAIRRKCLACKGENVAAVRECVQITCPLHDYRLPGRPTPSRPARFELPARHSAPGWDTPSRTPIGPPPSVADLLGGPPTLPELPSYLDLLPPPWRR